MTYLTIEPEHQGTIEKKNVDDDAAILFSIVTTKFCPFARDTGELGNELYQRIFAWHFMNHYENEMLHRKTNLFSRLGR
jgi:hypothetical protein